MCEGIHVYGFKVWRYQYLSILMFIFITIYGYYVHFVWIPRYDHFIWDRYVWLFMDIIMNIWMQQSICRWSFSSYSIACQWRVIEYFIPCSYVKLSRTCTLLANDIIHRRACCDYNRHAHFLWPCSYIKLQVAATTAQVICPPWFVVSAFYSLLMALFSSPFSSFFVSSSASRRKGLPVVCVYS